MRNPPDKFAMVMSLVVSVSLLIVGIFAFSSHSDRYALHLITAGVVSTGVGLLILVMVLWSELVLRPRNVEVGEKIVLRYPFNKKVEKEFDNISGFYILPETKKIRRRWTGGVVVFKDQRRGNEITHEIARSIEDGYRKRFNRIPPRPGIK